MEGGDRQDINQTRETKFPVAPDESRVYSSGYPLNPIDVEEMMDKCFMNNEVLNFPPHKIRRLDFSAHSFPPELTGSHSLIKQPYYQTDCKLHNYVIHSNNLPSLNRRGVKIKLNDRLLCQFYNSNMNHQQNSIHGEPRALHGSLRIQDLTLPHIDYRTQRLKSTVKKEVSTQRPLESQFHDLDFWFELLGKADLRPFLYDEGDQ